MIRPFAHTLSDAVVSIVSFAYDKDGLPTGVFTMHNPDKPGIETASGIAR